MEVRESGKGDVRSSGERPNGIVGPSLNGGGVELEGFDDRPSALAVASSADSISAGS